MRQSETIAELAKALSAAQGEIENASKDSKNPHFNSKYASLSATLGAIRGTFSKYGLSIVQTTYNEASPTGVAFLNLVTRLQHASGEWIEGDYPVVPVKADPQGYGSALTYARRYSAMSIAGIAAEDDDGAEASAPPRTAPSTGQISQLNQAARR